MLVEAGKKKRIYGEDRPGDVVITEKKERSREEIKVQREQMAPFKS